MTIAITEKDLPASLTPEQAVEAAYSHELADVASKLVRGLPVLVECDKELAPYMFMNLRGRLREAKLQCVYLDGRQREGQQQGAMPMGLIGTMIAQLRDAVRGAVERRVVVLPHLDLLTTSQGGLTGEAREVIPLLYENPELVWLGFKDPSFSLPKVIENLFPHWVSILGTSRNRLRHLITQKESRKFGKTFSPWQLYKYVSGVNAVRLRKLLSTLEGEDYPADPRRAYTQMRQATRKPMLSAFRLGAPGSCATAVQWNAPERHDPPRITGSRRSPVASSSCRSPHHSQTLPSMSYSPKALGRNFATGCRPRPLLSFFGLGV